MLWNEARGYDAERDAVLLDTVDMGKDFDGESVDLGKV